MGKWLGTWALVAATAVNTADPLATVRRPAGKTSVEVRATLETAMLLALLGSTGPVRSEFQGQVRSKFALYARDPAVRETMALMGRGFGYSELARFSMCLSAAPYFVLNDSPQLLELAALLPGADRAFNLDRLYGYSKLIREFYWDRHVGRFLRSSVPYYQQVVRRRLPADVAPGNRVILSPLAPVERIEFPVNYLVIGEAPPPQ